MWQLFPKLQKQVRPQIAILRVQFCVIFFLQIMMIINIQDTPLVGNSQDVLGPCDGIQCIAVSLSARTLLTGEGRSPRAASLAPRVARCFGIQRVGGSHNSVLASYHLLVLKPLVTPWD